MDENTVGDDTPHYVLLAALDCPAPFDEVGGRCVFVDTLYSCSWQTCRDQCLARGGDLVKVDSGDFFATLVTYIKGNGKLVANGLYMWFLL